MDIRAIAAMFSDYAVFGTDHPLEGIFHACKIAKQSAMIRV